MTPTNEATRRVEAGRVEMNAAFVVTLGNACCQYSRFGAKQQSGTDYSNSGAGGQSRGS